jgi:hypothetical protein
LGGRIDAVDALVPLEARDLECIARQRTVHIALGLKGKPGIPYEIARGVGRKKRLGSAVVR